MGNRPLAHIEKIVQTYSIEGADKVEMAQVLDYHVLVQKGQFKAGDLAVYIEVDSILPDGLPQEDVAKYNEKKIELKTTKDKEQKAKIEAEISEIVKANTIPEFEFLRPKKFTIKAMKNNKLGIVSMGILFPLNEMLNVISKLDPQAPTFTPSIGLDITSKLKIEKVVEDEEEAGLVEKPTKFDSFMMRFKLYRKLKKYIKANTIKGTWQPFFPSVSDEENIQKIYTKMYNTYGEKDGWVITEKLEGQNISCVLYTTKRFGFLNKKNFGICSRTRFLKTDDGSDFWKTAKKLNVEDKMRKIGKNLLLRGEHCGGKIQGNIYGLPSNDIYLFEVCDIDKQRFYTWDEFKFFCAKYDFKHAPLIDENASLLPTVQEMLDYSNANSVLAPVLREGIVWRRKEDTRISFKIRSPDYLIKHGK